MCPDTIVAVAAAENSIDTIWLIKVIDNACIANECAIDDYQNKIIPGGRYLKGHFLERLHTDKDGIVYKVSKLLTFFYKESIVYPFVEVISTKKKKASNL